MGTGGPRNRSGSNSNVVEIVFRSDPADVSHYGELGSNGKQQQQPPTLLLRDNDKWWSTKHTGLIYRTWEAFNAIHCEGMDGEDSQR